MPLSDARGHLDEVAHEAARTGQVVYLTERGQRLAAIVPAKFAARFEREDAMRRRLSDAGLLESLSPVDEVEPDAAAREAASIRAGQGRPLSEYVSDNR
jgi:prevent-host-death family protein